MLELLIMTNQKIICRIIRWIGCVFDENSGKLKKINLALILTINYVKITNMDTL